MSQQKPKSLSRSDAPLIYLVDDEAVLLDVAEASLQAAGYRTVKFSDPEVALRTFLKSKHRPALLITDYAMGKMNGIELLERCKQAEPGLKSILVSGTAGAEIMLDAPVQVDRFLAKPHPSEALCDLVRRVLGG
jgi:DNA-binding NtrC family response regulator